MKKIVSFWSIFPYPALLEVAKETGYNSVILDMEHGHYNWSNLHTSILLGQSLGLQVLVRPASKSESDILRCLEAGANGLMVPHVETAQEIKAIEDAVFYAPVGKRGSSGFTRSTIYGKKNFTDHTQEVNDSIFLGILIESKLGIKNLGEIIESGNVDCVYFGTYDIASSAGLKGQDSSDIRDLVDGAIEVLRDRVKYVGQISVDKNQYLMLNPRINFIAFGVDCGIILNGFANNISHID